jgi:anti-sigma B factor antagonist
MTLDRPQELPGVEVLIERRGDTLVLCLIGELDLSNATHVAEEFDQQDAPMTAVVVDLNGLTFCDSSGIRALGRIARRCDAREVPLSIVGARPSVRRVLEIAGVAEMFHVAPQ